jgi:hypothetical protein
VVIPPFLGQERMQVKASPKRKQNDKDLANPKKKNIGNVDANCERALIIMNCIQNNKELQVLSTSNLECQLHSP